jgi:O-antigen/teichoic acid export membrane protein
VSASPDSHPDGSRVVGAAVADDNADDKAKGALPEGTIAVGIGLLVAGVSAYGFLSVARHALGKESFASLSQLWFLTFIVAPGVFLPVEQEVGRALAHRRALGQGSLPVARKAGALALGLAGIVGVLLFATSPVLVSEVFHGSWWLWFGLVVSFIAYACTHFARGVLSGSGDFPRYGLLMGSDGLLRVTGCVVLSAIGVTAVGPFGLLVGIPPFIAVSLALRGRRHLLKPGPPANWSEITPNLGWLLVGSVLSASLVNAGPLAANLLANKSQRDVVSSFAAGVLIARVPLFLFQAVQAALLPKLATLAAQGELTEFREGFKKLMVTVVSVGLLGTVGAFLLGPWAVATFFDEDLTRRTLGLLAAASALYMVSVALAQAIIALHGHARVALGWAAGMLGFLVVTAFAADDLLLRVELGLVASSASAMAVFIVTLRAALRRGVTPDPDSVLEALFDMPSEP